MALRIGIVVAIVAGVFTACGGRVDEAGNVCTWRGPDGTTLSCPLEQSCPAGDGCNACRCNAGWKLTCTLVYCADAGKR